jgi:nucleotide-binding universal stress UspA family protein
MGWSRRRRLGSTARSLVQQISRPVLILEQGARLSLPVGVIYDGSPRAQRSLNMAFDLLREAEGYLTVIILAEDIQTAQVFQAAISERLREHGLKARFRWLIKPDRARLQDILHTERCGLLIMPGESGIFEGETLTGLLNEISCPIILVR